VIEALQVGQPDGFQFIQPDEYFFQVSKGDPFRFKVAGAGFTLGAAEFPWPGHNRL